MKHLNGLIIACAVALTTLTACKYDTSPSPGVGDPYPPPGNDPQISVLSPELRPWIGFQPAVVVRDDKAPMRVEVPARNSTYNKYLIEYRFLYYGDNGLEVTPTMGWQMIAMEPKQIVRLKGAALSTDAKAYRLEVKWSK